MKNFFEKNETFISIALIVIYVLVGSYLRQNFGIAHHVTTITFTVMTVLITALIISIGRVKYYGLTTIKDAKKYMFFLPLLLLATVSFWTGFNTENTAYVIAFHTLSMLNVGFLEEVIFRGFLFKMMEKDGLKSAILVSSLTFGIGHIVNLFNGEPIFDTLAQICYAVAIGFVFVIVFYRTKTLIPCIIAHGVINSTSIYQKDPESPVILVAGSIFLIVVSLVYAFYILKVTKGQPEEVAKAVEE